MGDRDPFGDLVAGCRKLNMVVIARTDPHAAHQDVYDAHPDWIAVDAEGKKRQALGHARAVGHLCARVQYNFEFMTEGYARDRRVDTRSTACSVIAGQAPACATASTASAISKLRRDSSCRVRITRKIPRRRAYIGWRQQRLFELWRLWDAEIRKVHPTRASFQHRRRSAQRSRHESHRLRWRPRCSQDRQRRRGLAPPWESGKNGKEYRATMGRKAIGGIFSVGTEEPYRWKDSVQSGPEIRLVGTGRDRELACVRGFTKFAGTLHDRRWLPVVEGLYDWHYRNERYLRNTEPLARVAMMYSQQTAHFYGGERARRDGSRITRRVTTRR
jgi:hypothetical protein